MGKNPHLELGLEALGDSIPEGSKGERRRVWQGRRQRGRVARLGRENGTEDPRFGKAVFPLAPPLPRGYNEGGGGVAGVPDVDWLDDGALIEPNLTNAERAWLDSHDMPFGTANRVEVLRRIQRWDAEVAIRLSRLLGQKPGRTCEPLGSLTLRYETSSQRSTRTWLEKKTSRTRKKKSST